MKNLSLGMMVVGAATLIAGCERTERMRTSAAPSPETVGTEAAPDRPRRAVMHVHGMGCPQCAHNVDLQLLKVQGVKDVKVDMGSGRVTATLAEDNPPSREQLANAIRQTGFTLVRIEME